MALTIQNVIDDVSYESRLMLDGTSGSGGDFNLIVRWVDQVQKDILHTTIYKAHLRGQENVSSTSGTSNYTMTAVNIAEIEYIFNRTFNKLLFPWHGIAGVDTTDPARLGAPNAGQLTPTQLMSKTDSPWPEYYELQTVTTTGTNVHTLWVFPAPQSSTYASSLYKGNCERYRRIYSTHSARRCSNNYARWMRRSHV